MQSEPVLLEDFETEGRDCDWEAWGLQVKISFFARLGPVSCVETIRRRNMALVFPVGMLGVAAATAVRGGELPLFHMIGQPGGDSRAPASITTPYWKRQNCES